MNAEFQTIARIDKKAFLSDQGKEIEENNRMGKTIDLFKKIRDTEGMFHAKMGTIKARNGMDLTVAGDIKNRWQEYTEELYIKDLHDPDNHDGSLSILWHCLSLGLERELTFSSPVATAEFSKFAGIWSRAFLTASSFRIRKSSTGIPSPPLAFFVVMLPKAHLKSLTFQDVWL